MLLGGPVFSLLLTAGFSALRFDGLSFQSGFLADGAIEFFLNTALSVNLVILVLSALPMRCFHGATRGLETDGLQDPPCRQKAEPLIPAFAGNPSASHAIFVRDAIVNCL